MREDAAPPVSPDGRFFAERQQRSGLAPRVVA
jgi:hypothetical protein